MITLKPLSNPIMIVGDNPSLPGGLSRQARDIATLCCTMPEFRVGFLGRGIGNRRKFPFTLYDFPETGQWGEHYIQDAWGDFAERDSGIIMTTDDLSRRHWFANPHGLSPELVQFLGPGRNYLKWAYVPVDSTGPNGESLSLAGVDCSLRYDRVLATSEWGQQTLIRGGRKDTDWLPHGIWMDKFHPILDSKYTLEPSWGVQVVVGSVMANQARKDYPALFQAIAGLKKHYGNQLLAWIHTDAMIGYWNLYALAADYGVGDCLEITMGLNDDQLAARYSACDCTLLPSAGEGFGFPIAESLACGTACVVTDYGAGQELVEENCRVQPMSYRIDTQHNVMRAVLSGIAFVEPIREQIELKIQDPEYRSAQLADSVSHLDWNKLRHCWERWLREGLK